VEVAKSKDDHAEGQKDYNEGKHEPPHSITPVDHLIHDEPTLDELQRENDRYGSRHKTRRIKGSDVTISSGAHAI